MIVNAVKKRFNSMYREVAPRVLEPLGRADVRAQLRTRPRRSGDATFKEVPLGVDPSQWPLDIDVQQTVNEANANPVTPGGLMKVYGNFCWL